MPTACLGRRIGIVAPPREREVKRALGYALGWAELKMSERPTARSPMGWRSYASIVTLIDPVVLSAAVAKALPISASGKRCVMSVSAIRRP